MQSFDLRASGDECQFASDRACRCQRMISHLLIMNVRGAVSEQTQAQAIICVSCVNFHEPPSRINSCDKVIHWRSLEAPGVSEERIHCYVVH